MFDLALPRVFILIKTHPGGWTGGLVFGKEAPKNEAIQIDFLLIPVHHQNHRERVARTISVNVDSTSTVISIKLIQGW